MNFEKLKEASAQSTRKALSEKEVQSLVLELVAKMPTEQATIQSYLDKLTLNESSVFEPYKDKGYSFRAVFAWDKSIRYVWQQTKFESDMFFYDIIDNELIRRCRYRDLAVYYDAPHKCDVELISNIVTCEPVVIKLTDDEVECLKSAYIDDKWFKRTKIAMYGYDIYNITNDTLKSKLQALTGDNSIIACETNYYTGYDRMDGRIAVYNFYPDGYQNGFRYLAKEEAEKVINYRKADDDFIDKYRNIIIEDIKAADFNTSIEQILCDAMKKHDCSHNKTIDGKFTFCYPHDIYKFECRQPEAVLIAKEGPILYFECMNAEDEVITFKDKDIMSFTMSDTFWKYDTPQYVLNSINLFVGGHKVFYEEYGTSIEKFYDAVAEVISQKVAETGLNVVECHACFYEDGDIDVRIEIDNPVYAGEKD